MHPLYTPADMIADLSSGSADVLPYVGAGVGGALVLMFAFLGIRAGFNFFLGLAYERGYDRGEYVEGGKGAAKSREYGG